MKYILNENIKHILSEKYLLDERYILTEAPSSTAIANKWIAQIKAKLPTVKKVLNDIANNAKVSETNKTLEKLLRDIKTATDTVNNSRRLPSPSDELKNDLSNYYKKIKALFDYLSGLSTENKTKLSTFITKNETIHTATSTDAWDEDKQDTALRNFDSLNTVIATLPGASTYGADTKKINELVKLIRDPDGVLNRVDELDAKYLVTPEVGAEKATIDNYIEVLSKTLWPVITAIIKLDGSIQSPIPDKDIADEIYYLPVQELGNVISDVAKNLPKKAVNGYQVIDWGKKYSQCHTDDEFNAFWQQYYKAEWKDKAEVVSKFGGAFREDLEEYGWNATVNPFIAFLKSDEIYNIIGNTFGKNAYIIIHNALVNGDITKEDLKASESSIYGKANLIYNQKLYITGNIKSYLKVQKDLKNYSSKLKNNIAIRWNTGQQGHGEVLKNLMSTTGDIKDFKADIPDSNYELRAVNLIKQIFENMFTESFETKTDAASTDIEKVIKWVNDNGGEGTAKSILAYLVIVLRFINQGAVEAANKKIGGEKLFKLATEVTMPTVNKMKEYDRVINFNELNYSKTLLTDLLLGLAKVANIYTE